MIRLAYMNESYGKLIGDIEDIMNLWDHFAFYVPGYRFMPGYKNGTWDGMIRLINLSQKTFPVGLLNKIVSYCSDSNIQCYADSQYTTSNNLTENEIHSFIHDRKYFSKKKEIFPREDQIRAVTRAILENRCINICPTSFGKSLCIFIEALWHIQHNRKVMIVVPNVNLVAQFKNDIIDYCTNSDGEFVDLPAIQEIHAGYTKEVADDIDIVITTWQSIYKLDSSWLNQFGCIILDEAHKGKASCIREVYDNATQVKYRTGWTGSLKNSSLTALQAEALIGPSETITDTATLMESGVIADLTVQLVCFKYPDSTVDELGNYFETKSKITDKGTYADEIKFLESYYQRNQMILKLTGCFNKTGLILYNHIKHGKELVRLATEMFPDRNIYRIDGTIVECNGIKYKTYEELKSKIENENDAILICSFGVFSTGISIKNIHYIVFSVPIKSYVRTIQSIGRGLRISASKNKVQLIDIVDDLCTKTKTGKTKRENYAYKHFKERFCTYAEQKFKYNMLTIPV